MKAIAAMAENRVIGIDHRLPWRLPEDFEWFKQLTTGQVVVMGRKTFESIGQLLPNRTTIVLSRSGIRIPGVRVLSDAAQIESPGDSREVYICGGGEVYAQLLPLCSDLYLTLVKRVVAGDTFFPPFEDRFVPVRILRDRPEFTITHYRNRTSHSGTSAESTIPARHFPRE